MSAAYEIRESWPGEIEELSRIAHEAKKHWGYPDNWIEAWSAELTITNRYLGSAHVFTVDVEGEPVAFYALKPGGNEISMDHFWVLPEYMGRGIGRAMFEHAVAQAKGMGGRVIEIDSDPNAVGFYQKMGASQVRINRTSILGKPRDRPVFQYRL